MRAIQQKLMAESKCQQAVGGRDRSLIEEERKAALERLILALLGGFMLL
jgi:hypothetical protein